MKRDYEVVIGLEVHVQLNTESKMFCSCSTKFGSSPNTQVCPVCLGFPGVLPVVNKKAMDLAMMTAMALNCGISKFTKFDRKHYFYPDLPKNFQTSQFDKPLSRDGYLEIKLEKGTKKVRLKRIHIEEDAGKLIHQEGESASYVDYNRSGTPLLEIVTEPDIYSPDEAYGLLTQLKSILEYLEVSDCNMEEGSLRCDANISLRPAGQSELGVKTEVKNMNSFKGIKQALNYETDRQMKLLNANEAVIQETRLWNSDKEVTTSMRTKEEAHDYRYFPEPDLLPIVPDDSRLDEIKKSIPELPAARKERFMTGYKLSVYDAEILTCSRKLADYFEATLKEHNNPKTVANWIMGDLTSCMRSTGLSIYTIPFKPPDLAETLNMIDSGKISGKMGKELLREAVETGKKPSRIVEEKGLSQVSDEKSLKEAVVKVIASNPKAVEDFKSGKPSALGFLMGQIMKETKGKANPKLVNELLRKSLKEG